MKDGWINGNRMPDGSLARPNSAQIEQLIGQMSELINETRRAADATRNLFWPLIAIECVLFLILYSIR